MEGELPMRAPRRKQGVSEVKGWEKLGKKTVSGLGGDGLRFEHTAGFGKGWERLGKKTVSLVLGVMD